uniref:Uncharacterized protein n=1 Tax=Anguilla anguilla TaxID=7936 RepID=A0A0E9UNA2_ANGAN
MGPYLVQIMPWMDIHYKYISITKVSTQHDRNVIYF